MLQSIWRHKWVTVASMVLAIIAGAVYSARAIPMYPSFARLWFDPTRSSHLLGPSDQTPITDQFLHAQSELIASQPIVDRAAQHLIDRNDAQLDQVHAPLRLFPKGMTLSAAVTVIRAGLDVSVGKDNQILLVSFTSPYPLESQAVTEELITSYITYEQEHHKNAAEKAMTDLNNRKEVYDKQVLADRAAIADYIKKNPSVETPSQSGQIGTRSQVDERYETARLATVDAKLKLDEYLAAASPAATQPTAIAATSEETDLTSQTLGSMLAQAELTLQHDLARGLTENNPTIVADRTLIARTKRQYAASVARENSGEYFRLRDSYANAVRTETKIKELKDTDEQASLAIRTKQNELGRLKDEEQDDLRASALLGDKIREDKPYVESGAQLEVDVMDHANIPAKPDGARSRTLGMAAILGLLVGVGVSLGLDVLDQRLRSPEDARNLLGLPILGVLPHQPGKLSNAACGLIAHSDPMSDVAEAARSVRTAVFFASRSTPVKTVLVASPSKGDGKSVFASNLAIAMAQAGSRTLLIDADFRNPSLETIFDVQSGSGLSEVLAGRSPVEKSIRRTPIEGLEVLPCGPIPRNPSEMLNSQAFGKLIEQLSDRYQCILLDSPPAMSVTDARILGAMADVTLYVVRTGQTSRKAADQGLDLLLSVGSRVLGAVVNDAPNRTSRRGRSGLRVWDSFQPDRGLNGGGMSTGVGPTAMPNGMVVPVRTDPSAQIAGTLAMGKPALNGSMHGSPAINGSAAKTKIVQSTDHPEVDVLD